MADNTSRIVAVIGAGYWGKNLVRNFAELGALRAICELEPTLNSQMREKYPNVQVVEDADVVLNDPSIQAVAIATPAATHGLLVRRALELGKDVYVEKPLCLSLAEGRALVSLAEARRRILMVGHLLWYHPAVLKLAALVSTGELGRLQYVYSNRLNLGKIRREENILWSFAPHDISVILGLLKEMPEAVHAFGANYLHQQNADVTVSILSFRSGVQAHVFVSWLHPFKEQKLVVVGDRKMAVFDDVQRENKLVLYPHTIDWRDHVPVATKAEAVVIPHDDTEPLRAECEHFLECLATRRAPRTDGREGLRVLDVLDQCERSLSNETFEEPGGYFRHPSSFVDEDVEVGLGSKIWHVSHLLTGSRIGESCNIGQNVVVGPNVTIGNRVKVQNNVSIYEGVTIEDDVFCGPSMVFTNVRNPRSEVSRRQHYRKTLVRKGATLGANCTVISGVTVGNYAFVGAGAVVLQDVPDFGLVVGNPARLVGYSCRCGERILFREGDGSGVCEHCHRAYYNDGETVRER